MSSTQSSKLTLAVLRLALIIGVVTILHYGKDLLLPLAVAGLLAMLLNPLDEKLRSWGWSSGLSIFGALSVLLLVFVLLFAAVGQQAVSFAETWPQTQENISEQFTKLRTEYGLEGVIPNLKAPEGSPSGGNLMKQLPISGSGIRNFLSGTFGIVGDFLLMLVYVVLLLSQKERLREFVIRRAPEDKRGLTHQSINESRNIVQKYLRGRLVLIAILSVLYSVGFMIVGMDYAILIAVLVAVLSIIPYLGNIIGGLFAVALAFSGGGGSQAVIGVVITMGLAQVLESYVLTPLIVGDEVDINPLTTIICVVGMSLLWGAVGAIVAIPLFAILRIVFSHVDGLEDYAYLMGQR